jgi:hypothetical protein
MKTFRNITFFVGSFLISLVWVLSPTGVEAKSKLKDDNAWVIVKPVQCLGNPWEKDWLGKHKNRVDKYPRAKEFDIMKSFFKKKGVPLLDLRIKRYVNGDPLCQACDCPRGDTLYFLLHEDDVPKMIRYGYTDRIPADEVPKNNPADGQ